MLCFWRKFADNERLHRHYNKNDGGSAPRNPRGESCSLEVIASDQRFILISERAMFQLVPAGMDIDGFIDESLASLNSWRLKSFRL